MAKIKVHTANFPYSDSDIRISGGSLFIQSKTTFECIIGSQIKSLELANEENVKKIGGTLGWSVVGGVIAGPVGVLAGAMLGGKRKDVTFVVEFDDGRTFMGTVDSKSFSALKAKSTRL
ncbi:hypothetical protein [Vibrio harveyi]|uniref:hypothetical protein n=1 Tax=Vibrio harveyi TaxID=669 RepID=UPI003BB6BE92